ncbi:serine phosphatase RsbU, regulator of sigma subunit [Frankia casuarinae]|uniref:Response regulator receiver modulated serine phosphatase n=2 Tax=Frankia casuarinae (strain DSM 45818 / CECT 9043 / HFP020203 / CcI3) TaxID=106370 RepID=Q2JGB5_FRACC|nr:MULTISPECIES: SpoIIE family protein phosphatase [Frankia]ABD09677.1 response regulator receiver modulated serine phosphatase [Frankia casuarinae]ETA03616.1 serine phosphatase RsbU, regulator of sigma subunit [Frankia sp. CcI6]EYT90358.1 serine phosphatase RsbU, regulator of sigma subunit [Frankia casuarinae]KDA43936.1 serine phosphatase RsbU, regulator of sigma subunit [Frankia sp. BMG5.23]KFB05267.1 serine phosphatase RsbU, regulator of sigma subunit [Frankia sp. Allo2]
MRAPNADPVKVIWPVLLVEDDDADAYLVSELLDEVSAPVELTRVRTVAEAARRSEHVACVLLDLGLPDSEGLSALRRLLTVEAGAPVVVLTGLVDEYRGAQAVAAGAQDYLVKGQVDGRDLVRAVRYAIERKRADTAAQALRESELLADERARLERGLLPRPLIDDGRLHHDARYRPGRQQSLLGGDFYDMVSTADGTLHVLLGDVCGHGPDEAALGVSLRIAWRTLVLAGVPEPDRLGYLQRVLVSEREQDEIFATVCTLAIAPDRTSARMRLAGHPPPALLHPRLSALPGDVVGPALGIVDDDLSEEVRIELGPHWALLLATDGLLEGREGPGGEPLGWEGVLPEIAKLWPADDPDGLLDNLIDRVEARNGGPLTDDVALLLLIWGAG